MKVSKFKSAYDKVPCGTVDLLEWLCGHEHRTDVLTYRKGLCKKEKLPCVLPAGLFNGKKMDDFVKGSGILFIDIDAKSNKDIASVRDVVVSNEYVLAVQSSTGGKGLGVFFKVSKSMTADKYRLYYKQLELAFRDIGVVVDPACKNINRVRFASVDADTYINRDAKLLPLTYKEAAVKRTKVTEATTDFKADVLQIVQRLEKLKHDITGNYNDWLYIAGCLKVWFGYDEGMELFLRISAFHPDYSAEHAADKFDRCKEFKDASPTRLFKLLNAKPNKK